MKLLLIGPPASGKGTQGEKLSDYLQIPLIQSGAMLRALPETHPRYQEVHDHMSKGELVPQDFVAQLLAERTGHEDCANGYILDGWGRTAVDLEYFDPGFDKVLYYILTDDSCVARITARRVCPDGHTYSMLYNPPKNEGICDEDGLALYIRDDDKEAVVRERLELFHEETMPVVESFRSKGLLVEIDAAPLPDEIFENTKELLNI